MARSPKPPKSSKQVDALKHDAASRRNIPTAEMESFFRRDEDASPMPPKHYPRARPLAEGATRTSEEPRVPELIWSGARITITDEQMKELADTGALTLSDAQLVWRGKDKQDWSDLVVNVPPSTSRKRSTPRRSSTISSAAPPRSARRRPPRPICSPTSTASNPISALNSTSMTSTGRTA
jgi:adenine-specific DNA-methyltransferase